MTPTHCQTPEYILRNTRLIKGTLKGASSIQVVLKIPMIPERKA